MSEPQRRPGSRTFDFVMVALLVLLVVGGHVLVWADDPQRDLVSGNQLFSIWALPLYLGFLPAAYLLLVWWSARRRAHGGGVPLGYRAALIGAAIFLLALSAEFAWRAVAGRPPQGPEGVLSPSRLALFVGAALMVSGPLLSIRNRLATAGLPRRVASADSSAFAVTLGLLLSLTTLLTGFVHPFVVLAAAPIDVPVAQTPTDLYLVPLDGSGSRRLTVTPDDWEAHPDVSADGTLAYARGPLESFRVFIGPPDARQPVRLDARDTHQDGPVFEPGGSRITFWAELSAPAPTPTPSGPGPAPGPSGQPQPIDLTGLAIWIHDQADGSSEPLHQVGGEGVESWSRDGTTLCGWTVAGGSFDIATWDVATGASGAVTTEPSQEWGCSWAPDGARVAFHSDRSGNWELYSAKPDGTDVRQLTDDDGIDQWPRWSPNGTQLAWMSSRDGDLDIFVADADGANPRNITNDPALEDGFYGLTWIPDGSGLVAASAGRPYTTPAPTETVPLGVGALTLNALIVVGVLLFALRLVGRMVGVGTIAGLIGGLLAALVGAEPLFFVATLCAGIGADLVMWRSPNAGRRTAVTLAGVAASVLVTSYFVVLGATRGIGWGLDLVLGSIALASVLAMGLALVVGWSDRSEGESAESGATIS